MWRAAQSSGKFEDARMLLRVVRFHPLVSVQFEINMVPVK